MKKAVVLTIGCIGVALSGCSGSGGSGPTSGKQAPTFAIMKVPGFTPTQTVTLEELSMSPLTLEEPCPQSLDPDLKKGTVYKRSVSHSFNGTGLSYVATENIVEVQPQAFGMETVISDFRSDSALSPFRSDRIKQMCALVSSKQGVTKLDCLTDPQDRVDQPFKNNEAKAKLLDADCKQTIDFSKPPLFTNYSFGTYKFEDGTTIPVYASQAVVAGSRKCGDKPEEAILAQRMVIGTNQVVMPVSRVRCEERVLFRYSSTQLPTGEMINESKEQVLQAPVTSRLVETQPKKANRTQQNDGLIRVSI